MSLPNPIVNETVNLSGEVQSWAVAQQAMDQRFGVAGNIPIFRVATGTLVAKVNSVGGHYAPGLGGGGNISGNRLYLPSDLGTVVVAQQPNKPTALALTDRVLGLTESGAIVNEAV